MSEPRDLRELLGEDVPAEELEELRRVDALLRSVPPPPQVPDSLDRAVMQLAAPTRRWTRRRGAGALALAAALSALFFGVGFWVGGDDFETRATIPLEATASAASAHGVIRLGEHENGNIGIEIEVVGLKPLPERGYYVLWLAKDGEYAATCGSFNVDEAGSADVYMNASYPLEDYDEWVITAHLPGRPPEEAPWLLRAPVRA